MRLETSPCRSHTNQTAMHVAVARGPAVDAYELRFTSLFNDGRALAFPCDADGRVDLDALSERARSNYFYARAVVGREFACPSVRRSAVD